MSPVVHGASLFLLAGAAFLLVGSMFSTILVRFAAARVIGLEPSARHRVLVLLASLPLIAAGALLFAVSLPSLLSLANPRWDHCLTHDDGHAHLCFVHLPVDDMHAALQLGLVFGLTYVALRVAASVSSMLHATRYLRVLAKTAEPREDAGVRVLETSVPVCLAAGLLHPTILISRGLLNSLSDEECSIVFAHEREHVRRRDPLIRSWVRACSVLHFPRAAGWLVREHAIAAEQCCDEVAAEVVGDRVAVAAAILSAERAATLQPLVPVAAAFGVCGVARRVEALLEGPKSPFGLARLYLGLSLGAVALLFASAPLHHATETVLSYVAH